MKSRLHLGLICLLILGNMMIFSCGGKKGGKAIPVTFQNKELNQSAGTCDQPETDCCKLKLQYLEAKGENASANQAINSAVKEFFGDFLKGNAPDSTKETDLDKLSDLYIASFKQYADEPENDEYAAIWEFQGSTKVIYQSERLVTIQMDVYDQTGGAYPYIAVQFLSVDLVTGKLLKIKDLAKDEAAFTTYVESKFRAEKGLSPDESLEDAGYYWPNNKFELPENFAITKDSIRFRYNDGEIAPHVLGETEIAFTRKDLEKYIKWEE